MNKITIIVLLIILVGAGYYFFKGNSTDIVVTNFEECMADTNNVVMESFPRQCRDLKTGNLFVEEVVDANATTTSQTDNKGTACTDEQRKADVCVELYEPVCATVNVQCIKAPCDPIKETFSNSCTACINPLVESYTQGECK